MKKYLITEACVACDICRAACPQEAILPGEHLYGCGRETCRGCPESEACESQIPAIRGPFLIDRAKCDGCGLCVRACVLGAIVEEESDAA